MAASKPTSWLFMQHHILPTTKSRLGTLAGGLGCLPLDHEAYPPWSDSCGTVCGIRSLIVLGTPVRAREQSVALPPQTIYARLALKLFRREPAITEFDWPFTPIHSSSKHFST